MKRFILLLVFNILLFGCLSQPIKPVPPGDPNIFVPDVAPTSGAVDQSQSKNYWSATSPIAIIVWKYSGNSLTLSIKNVDGTKITLSEINLDGSLVFSTDTIFNPGETKTITANMPTECGATGSRFSIDEVSFVYTKNSIKGFIQKGSKPIAGTCS
jgi:hypothetical protein